MSTLKKIREEQNLTQEELAEKSGLSVRTIQRVEAGRIPKGYTLKMLLSSLNISEEELKNNDIPTEENEHEQELSPNEKEETANYGLIKIINLSSIPFAWFPVANFLIPLLLMLFTKEKSSIVKQIISLQIIFAIAAPLIFMIVILLKLGKAAVPITIILLTLLNIYMILRNTYEIDRHKKLRYTLNFNII